MVKTQCCEPCEVFYPWFEPHRRKHFTTSQQSTQLSILPRSVNEYSEVTLRANTGHTLTTANLKVEVFHPVQIFVVRSFVFFFNLGISSDLHVKMVSVYRKLSPPLCT